MADLKLLTCITLSFVLVASLPEQKYVEQRGFPNEHNESTPFCVPTSDFDFDCGVGELGTRCISALWRCDNVHDCTSGLDEIGCNYLHKCAPGTLMCTDGDCYLANQRCDGKQDCSDGRDEQTCPKNTPKDATSQAEAIVSGHGEESDDDHSSSADTFWALLFLFAGFVVAIVLFCCLVFRSSHFSDSETSSRVDQALKDFNRNVGSSARRLISTGRGAFASSSRVTMSNPAAPVPGTSSTQGPATNDQFFDNPMNTLPYQSEPLLLRVPSASSLQQQQPPTV